MRARAAFGAPTNHALESVRVRVDETGQHGAPF